MFSVYRQNSYRHTIKNQHLRAVTRAFRASPCVGGLVTSTTEVGSPTSLPPCTPSFRVPTRSTVESAFLVKFKKKNNRKKKKRKKISKSFIPILISLIRKQYVCDFAVEGENAIQSFLGEYHQVAPQFRYALSYRA